MKSKLIIIAASAIFVMTSMPTFVHAKERLVVNCFWPPKHQVCNKLLPEWLAEVKKSLKVVLLEISRQSLLRRHQNSLHQLKKA